MFFAAQNNTWLAAQEDVFDNFYDVRTAKSTFFAENAPFFVLNIKKIAHVTFVVLCNPMEKTASKSVNDFSSYKRTNSGEVEGVFT